MELYIETCWAIFCRKVKVNLFVCPPTVLFLRFSEAQQGIFSLTRLTKEITITLSDRSLPVVMKATVFHGTTSQVLSMISPLQLKLQRVPFLQGHYLLESFKYYFIVGLFSSLKPSKWKHYQATMSLTKRMNCLWQAVPEHLSLLSFKCSS